MSEQSVSADNGHVIHARGLVKDYPTPEGPLRVLDGVDLDVAPGEIVAITGESGAGKSTLLHLLGGLDRATSGSIEVTGVDLAESSDDDLARLRNRTVGFVFQFHHLLPDFTALENVMVPRLMAGVEVDVALSSARTVLESVGLAHRLEHRPGELSGGEQQRVAVARALVNDPALVLADEPSGNLDPRHSGQLHDLMWDLARGRGSAFVIVTHDRALARRADSELRLVEGKAEEVSDGTDAMYL